MALQDTVLPVDFGQGMDTKADPKMIVPGKFQLIENGIFTNKKRITKRNGYDDVSLTQWCGTSISNPKMIKAFKNERLCVATSSVTGLGSGSRLFSYSPYLSAWVDKGPYTSVKVTKDIVNADDIHIGTNGSISEFGSANSSMAIIGNVALYAYDYNTTATSNFGYKNTTLNGTRLVAIDLTTGTQIGLFETDTHAIDLPITVPGACGFSKVEPLGASVFGVFYVDSSNNVKVVPVTVTLATGITFGTAQTIGSCASITTLTNQFPYCYDVVTNATGAFVAVASRPNVVLYKINTSGVTTATRTIVSSGDISPITTLTDDSGRLWVYWGSATTDLYYSIYDSALSASPVLAATKIVTVPTTGAVQPLLHQVSALPSSTNVQIVFYSTYLSVSTTQAPLNSTVFSSIVTSTASISVNNFVANEADIYGKAFTISGSYYLPCVHISASGATGVLYDVVTGDLMAKFFPDSCEGVYTLGYNTSGAGAGTPVIISGRYPGFITPPRVYNSTLIKMASGLVGQVDLQTLTSSTNRSCYPSEVVTYAKVNAAITTIDFNHIDAYNGLIQQDTLVLNGGVLKAYDGESLNELGFTIDPDNISVSTATSGGSIASGTFNYFITFQRIDAQGNLYESAPSLAAQVFFNAGSTNTVNLVFPMGGSLAKIWRSDSNLGGNIAYLVGSVGTANSIYTGFNLASYDDTTLSGSLSAVSSRETLYTENGAILENIAPPPSMVLWTNNDRIFAVDSENEETTIQYSKTASIGTGVSFSTGQLELLVDSKNGSITGGSGMDEKTVVIKKNGIGFTQGDGANDAGTGSTFTPFQFIPSDVGGTNAYSVILFPGGLMFRTSKGIYNLSRGLQVGYIGADVEAYNSQDIRSAVIVDSKSQIRFLTSSGSSLLFDYIMDQWSVFTNHTGYSADIIGGVYYYARTDGHIYSENTTSFLDGSTSYNLKLTTTWLSVSSVQNFQRVRWVSLLGDFTNGASANHKVQIQTAYDFVPTYGSPVQYTLGVASASGPFQYRNLFAQQKCDTLSMIISEVSTGSSGEYLDLSNMSFVAGLKKGTNKTNAAQSVG